MKPDIQTVCLGQANSAAAVLLAAGTEGKRLALPSARVLIHQPFSQGSQGQVSDLEIQAAEVERLRRLMERVLAEHCHQTLEQVSKDVERDNIFTAEEAKEYGLVDQVVTPREIVKAF